MSLTLDTARPEIGDRPRECSSRPARLRRSWRVAMLVGAAITGIMLGRLFIGGVVGLSDQGEGHRLLCTVGVTAAHPFDGTGAGHLQTLWPAHRWYGETCETNGGEPYPSTQLWLLWTAKFLTSVFFGEGDALDLRALGVLCSVLAGLLCAGLVLVLRGNLLLRAFVAFGVGMVFADSAFAGYFISPYGEPATFLGTVAIILVLIVVWRRGHTSVPLLLCVAGTTLFTIAAMPQTAGYLLPIAIGVLAVPYRGLLRLESIQGRPRKDGRALHWYGRRWPALVALALTGALAVMYVSERPSRLNDRTLYDLVFSEILPHSPDPIGDLRALGLDPAWAGAAGSGFDSPHALVGTPAYDEFRDRAGWLRVGFFFGTHPFRLAQGFFRNVAATAELRPGDLGSYPAGSGRPAYAQEHRVPFYSWVFTVFRWANWLMLFEWIGLAMAGLLVVRHETLPRRSKVYGYLALWLSMAIPAQLWTGMLIEGTPGSTTHLVCVAFLTAVGLPVLAACSALLYRKLRSQGGGTRSGEARTAA